MTGENFIMNFLKHNPHQESKRVTKPMMRRAGLLAPDGESVKGFDGKTEVKGRLAIHRLRQQTNIEKGSGRARIGGCGPNLSY